MIRGDKTEGPITQSRHAPECLAELRTRCVPVARPGRSSADKDRVKDLERETTELCAASEILEKASAYFAQAELDRPLRK